MSISVSRMQQQNHINQLLSTAATGNGVVHDVDALLTPLHVPATTTPSTVYYRSDSRPERNLWRGDEIQQMLSIMQQMNAIELLNDKSVKSEKVFRNIEALMNQHGYRKKSHVQIWTKWKFLKSTYMTSRRSGTTPRMIPARILGMLHQMLKGTGATANLSAGTSECGNSAASLDGDSSNGAGSAAGAHMIISGVEGGCTNGKADEEEDGGFGMAHPIFGFRLGLVKQEPTDTGYETITENDTTSTKANTPENNPLLDERNASTSLHASTSNIQFRTEIKQEVLEEELAQPTAPAVTITAKPVQRLRLPERPTPLAAPAAAATSTPMQTAARVLQLPPLRIAPFAKEPCGNGLQAAPERLPPPLSIHAAAGGRPTRIQTGNSHSSNNNMLQRKILPKPHAMSETTITPVRSVLPREATIQTRGAAAAASNMPRLKHVPMRKTPYSLRPERTIPDLDELPLSPSAQYGPKRMPPYSLRPDRTNVIPLLEELPLSPPSPYGIAYNDLPSTSRQAMSVALQSSTPLQRTPAAAGLALKKRKHRLDMPWQGAANASPNGSNGGPTMHKLRRIVHPHPAQQYRHREEDDDDDVVNTQRQSFKAAQRQSPQAGMRAAGVSAKAARKDHEQYESALKDLGTSLRQMQREMITNFFEQQMELARKEHEFQMKQDVLIMQAFEEQTRHIMKTARDMLGLDLKEFSDSGTNKEQETEEAENASRNEDNKRKANETEGGVEDGEVTAAKEEHKRAACQQKKKERTEAEVVQTEMAAQPEVEQAESDEEPDEQEQEEEMAQDEMEEEDDEEGDEGDEDEEDDIEMEHEEEEDEDSEYLQDARSTETEEHDESAELSMSAADGGTAEDDEEKEQPETGTQ